MVPFDDGSSIAERVYFRHCVRCRLAWVALRQHTAAYRHKAYRRNCKPLEHARIIAAQHFSLNAALE